jgi:ERCC4-type nuclease
MSKDPEILIDKREKHPKTHQALKQYFETKKIQLIVGDYLLCDKEICIERKTAGDFVSSITDGRLVKQRENMVENFDHNYIIIVENKNKLLPWKKSNLSDNAIMGMKASLNVKYGIRTIQVPNEEYFAYMVNRIYDKHQSDSGLSTNKHMNIQKNSSFDNYQNMLMCIKGVGPGTAPKITSQYSSMSELVNADIGELTEIDGIGENTAERIIEILENPETEKRENNQKIVTRNEFEGFPEPEFEW